MDYDTDNAASSGASSQEDGAEISDMSEMQRLLDEQDVSFKSIKRGDVVEGQVVRIDPEEILVDIGLKSEGVLSTKELPSQGYGSLAELKVGDNVLVYVMQPETPEGHAVVSIRRARLERQWRIAQEQYERGELLEAEVIDHNKGGLIVNLEGIRGFVPISQILNLKREDTADNAETQTKLQAMVGRKLQLKIIEINRNRNRLILSERLAVQEWRQRRREELLNELQVGEVRRGVVSNLANFGAFVDLGGADGLVHISQLAWSRVNHPSEVLKVGQEVEVQVLSVDKDKKKIALSIKRAEVDPWTTVEQRYHPGQLVRGTITKIAPFGAFARIEDGVEGLIHLSELPPGTQDPKAALHEGQDVMVRILRIESERRRLGLSVRQAQQAAEAEAPEAPAAEAGAKAEAQEPAASAAEGQQPTAREPEVEEPQTAFAAAFRAAQANRDRDQAAAATNGPATPLAAADEATVAEAEAPASAQAEAAPEVAAPAEAPAALGVATETADVASAASATDMQASAEAAPEATPAAESEVTAAASAETPAASEPTMSEPEVVEPVAEEQADATAGAGAAEVVAPATQAEVTGEATAESQSTAAGADAGADEVGPDSEPPTDGAPSGSSKKPEKSESRTRARATAPADGSSGSASDS
jgi:small subunit ribosomal protein S1